MTSEVTHIRALEERDVDALWALSSQPRCLNGTLHVPYTSLREFREWLLHADSMHHQLVAEIEESGDARVVGMVWIVRNARPRRMHVASLGILVHDDYQRRGIGHELLRAALELARNWLQTKRVELSVFTDNKPAIQLYEKHGFVREGTARAFAFRNGEFVDCYAMAWLAEELR